MLPDLILHGMSDHAQLYTNFCRDYPPRVRTIDGVAWRYIAGGQGAETIVLLPGALGVADTAFHYFMAFVSQFSLLSLDYPESITRATPLLTAIATLFEAESTGPVHLVGGSYSGPVANAFAQRYPDYVRSLVFSNTGLPHRSRTVSLGAMIAAATVLPTWYIQWAMRRSIRRFLPNENGCEAFWRAYFAALIPRFTRQFVCSRARIFWDLCNRDAGGVVPGERGWRGPVLIVEAPHDPIFAASERARLHAMYPHAKRVVVDAEGHGSALKAMEAHIAAYAAFWTRDCCIALGDPPGAEDAGLANSAR